MSIMVFSVLTAISLLWSVYACSNNCVCMEDEAE